jgi:hypothetical protein
MLQNFSTKPWKLTVSICGGGMDLTKANKYWKVWSLYQYVDFCIEYEWEEATVQCFYVRCGWRQRGTEELE